MSGVRRTAVITGMGAVCSLGTTPDAIFDAVTAGTVGSREVARWQGEGLRITRAAVVDHDGLQKLAGATVGSSAAGNLDMPWASKMGLVAARRALADAGIQGPLGDRPFVACCTIGAPGSAEPADKAWASMDITAPEALARYAEGAVVGFVAEAIGCSGRVQCVMSTCAGGNYAVGAALDLVTSGQASQVLAGGVEEVSTMVFTSFHQLRAVAETCKPFDVDRKGLLFGEGAAFVVIEDEEHAKARGARILAYVLGVGYANDAHHLVAPDQDGAGAAMAVRNALCEAELTPADIDYVNAHGTGTEANDAAELAALRSVFADKAPALAVSSTKGATGHLMGAAGALEAVLTTIALQRGLLPYNVGLDTPIADAGVDLIRDKPRAKDARIAMSTGFGFGGNDAAIVLAKSGKALSEIVPRPVYVKGVAALAGSLLGVDAVLERFDSGFALQEAERRATFAPEDLLGKKGLRHVDRGAILWAAALAHDLADTFAVPSERAGAVFGAAYPAFQQVVGIVRDFQEGGATNVNPMRVPFATANCASSWWLIRRGIKGFSGAIGNGECAGLDAIVSGAQQIARGRVDELVTGGAEGELAELWTGLGRIGWHAGRLAEGMGALLLSASPAGAWARLVDSESTFNRRNAAAAAERAVERLLARQKLPLVDVVVTPRPLALETVANTVHVTGETLGETLGAGSALAAVVAVSLLRPPKRTSTQVLVVSDSMDGYATAALFEGV